MSRVKTLHIAAALSKLTDGHQRTHCQLDDDPSTMQSMSAQDFVDTVKVLTAARESDPAPSYVYDWEICAPCNKAAQEWVDRSLYPCPGDGSVHLDPADVLTETFLPAIILGPLNELARQQKTACGETAHGVKTVSIEQIREQQAVRTTCLECLRLVSQLIAIAMASTGAVCDGGPFRQRCPQDRPVPMVGVLCPNCAAGPHGDAGRTTAGRSARQNT